MRIAIIILLISVIPFGVVQGQNSTQMQIENPCEKLLINYINNYNIELIEYAKLLRNAVINPRSDKLSILPNNHLLRNDDATQLEEGDKEIIKCYNSLLASNPNDERLWLGLGDFYAILGIYHGKNFRDESLKCFDNASTKNLSNIDSRLKKAQHHYNYCAEEKAIQLCDHALLVDSDSWEAWNIKGFAYCDLNKNEDAMNCFNESLKINETNSDAYSGMASALVGTMLMKINDKNWFRQNERDTTKIEAEFAKANDYLTTARSLGNESKRYLIGMGDYYYAYGTYKQILSKRFKPNSREYKELSEATRDSSDLALISYADALMLDPSDCKLWDKEREVLSTKDHRYANAFNYASKMAQRMGYIS